MSWVKGKKDGAETVFLTVAIRRDKHGRVLSTHFPQDEDDSAVLQSWPGGGMEQVAFALLTEAVRREALFDVILKSSHQPEFRSAWKNSTEEGKGVIIQDLTRGVRESMNGVIGRLIGSAIRTALDLITSTGT